MTTNNPTAAGAKPAVISLDDRREPRDAHAVALRRNAHHFRRMAAELGAPAASAARELAFEPTAAQLADLEARTARLRDRSACLEDLRADFAPIAAALASASRIATRLDRVLRAGGEPTREELDDLVRVTNAIVNASDLDGNSLSPRADEAWQAAAILSGSLVVAPNGDVVNAKELVAC